MIKKLQLLICSVLILHTCITSGLENKQELAQTKPPSKNTDSMESSAFQLTCSERVRLLTAKLEHPNATMRRTAVLNLRDMGDGALSAVPALIAKLDDSDESVQRAAIIALDVIAPRDIEITNAVSRYVGKRLFSLLDLKSPDISPLRELVSQQKWSEALDAYRDSFISKMSRMPPMHCRYWAFGPTRGEELLEKGIVRGNPDYTPLMAVEIGKPGKVNWWPNLSSWRDEKPSAAVVMAPPTAFPMNLPRFYWANKLVREYARSGNTAYVSAFIGYYWDFFLQHADQLKAVLEMPDWQKQYNNPKQSTHPLFTSERMANFLSGMLSCCAKNGPLSFDGELNVSIKPVGEQDLKAAIDSRRLAIVLMGLHTTLGVMEQQQPVAPNQVEHALFMRLQWAKALEDFKGVEDVLARAEQDLDIFLHRSTCLPDGTSAEQAPYNMGFLNYYPFQKRWHPNASWLADLEQATRLRERYVFSLLRWQVDPKDKTKSVPMWTALSSHYDVPWSYKPLPELHDPVVEQIDKAMRGDGKGPAFTSIYFPYGGYVVSRAGWSRDDAWLFMKNARAPIGHSDPAFNGVQIGAFGETMLIKSYYNRAYDQDTPGQAYSVTPFSANTVAAVDGLLAQWPDIPGPAWEKPLPHRWLTGDHFDFAEGQVNRWAPVGTTDAWLKPHEYKNGIVHHREVVFLRQPSCFIITDRMHVADDKAHSYTQAWNFNNTFGKDDVSADNTTKLIITRRSKGPNIALHQFSAQPLTYTKYYGFLDESAKLAYGWKGKDVPKPDVHAKWNASGDNLVVSFVRPFAVAHDDALKTIEPLTANGATGFCASLVDGTGIEYLAHPLPGEINRSDISIIGRGLLRVTAPDRTVRGIVLDCESLNGAPSPLRNFEYAIEGGKVRTVAEIKVPETFRWGDIGNGRIVPMYVK